MKKRPILIIGSINMDLVARAPRLPRPGETVRGTDFQTIPGGKGANQAVAAARLGALVRIAGRLGMDAFGESLRAGLEAEGIAHDSVLATEGPSGIALIGVDDQGENAITIVAGANGKVSPEDVASWEPLICEASALVVQLEIPIETVEAAVSCARKHGVLTVLDPAPARAELPDSLYNVDVFSPNQTEASLLSGIEVTGPESAESAAKVFHEGGAKQVVVKLGDQGALVFDGTADHVPAFSVLPVDTTAAGDAFTAALTVGLVKDMSIREATRFACAAGALAATQPGAQPGMPTLKAVESWLT